MSNWHSLPFWCLSTNAFQRFWSHSKFQILRNCSSSSTRSCFDQIFSDDVSSNCCLTYIRRLGTWNSIGITTSNPKFTQNDADWMLDVTLVLYTHNGILCHTWSYSRWRWSATFCLSIMLTHLPPLVGDFSYVWWHNSGLIYRLLCWKNAVRNSTKTERELVL